MRNRILSFFTFTLILSCFSTSLVLAESIYIPPEEQDKSEREYKRCNYQIPVCTKGSHLSVNEKDAKGCYILECKASVSRDQINEARRDRLKQAIKRRQSVSGDQEKVSNEKNRERLKRAEVDKKKVQYFDDGGLVAPVEPRVISDYDPTFGKDSNKSQKDMVKEKTREVSKRRTEARKTRVQTYQSNSGKAVSETAKRIAERYSEARKRAYERRSTRAQQAANDGNLKIAPVLKPLEPIKAPVLKDPDPIP